MNNATVPFSLCERFIDYLTNNGFVLQSKYGNFEMYWHKEFGNFHTVIRFFPLTNNFSQKESKINHIGENVNFSIFNKENKTLEMDYCFVTHNDYDQELKTITEFFK